MSYTTKSLWWKGSFEVEFSDFKNPINTDQMTGFELVTSDHLSFVIDKTFSPLSLKTLATVAQPFEYTEIYPLGDVNGNNVGKVGTENIVQITVGLSFPLQPYCVFQFKFPPLLQMNKIYAITGQGIFDPDKGDTNLDAKYYSYNLTSNELIVTGCLNPD
jgi:hypothetical protein